MLKKLTLSNFQCHRKVEIEFSPTVTTIIGKNDAGKTAVLRALRYLCLNKPRGVGFIRRKQKRMIARLEFDDRILIRKAGKVNSYSLDGKLFKAFRADVPQEIATALNVSDLNFQRQHDPVFWLSLSPGQLAKQLNSLVDLNTIDHTQTTISRRLRTVQTELDFCNSARSDARRTRNNLYLVDKLTRMDETRDLLDRLSIGIDDETPRSAYGTRYHFSDGPCDGLELFVRGIPHQIELMVLSAGHPSDSRRTAATYRHIGEPGEPDQLAPFFSVDLDHVPDQTTIPAVGN